MSQYRSNYKGGPRTQSDNSRPDRSDRSDRLGNRLSLN